MPGLLFSAANAALVAYGQVVNNGSTATTMVGTTQSGAGQFTVSRYSTGLVYLDLPTGFAQDNARSLLMCQSLDGQNDVTISVNQGSSQTRKAIYTYRGGSATDLNFAFMLFANELPNP